MIRTASDGETMTEHADLTVMQRKAGALRDPFASPVMSAGRAWFLTMPKVADTKLDLEMTVLSLRESQTSPEAFLEGVERTSLLLRLRDTHDRLGLAVLDASLLTALIEIQMVGVVNSTPVPDRRPTATDAAISSGIFDAWAEAFDAEVAVMKRLPFWTGARAEGALPDTRAALLALPPDDLHVAQLALDLGAGARQGVMWIAMPDAPAASTSAGRKGAGADMPLGPELRPVLMESRAAIEVVLHRPRVPFAAVKSFKPGDLVPIPVDALSTATLEDFSGRQVARARLGQMEGMRAVRVDLSAPGQEPSALASAAMSALAPPPAMNTAGALEHADLPPMADMPDLPPLPDAGLPDLPDTGAMGSGGPEAQNAPPDLPDLPELPDLPDLPDLPKLD